LYQIVEKQDARYAQLQAEMEKLKSWSDLNDHYLQEQIDANGAALDRLLTVMNELHDHDIIVERVEELKEEDSMPVAQLLREFIEENATEEQKEELNCK
jgi:hypothetical protein